MHKIEGRLIQFFKPTRIKFLFLVEWAIFLLLLTIMGELSTWRQILVTSYPLLFFYLLGCVLTALQQRTRRRLPFPRVIFLAILFIMIDQTMKFLVEKTIPLQGSIPILSGWLHLSYERNLHGSWVLAQVDASFPAIFITFVKILIPLLLLCMILIYRHFIANKRYSLWALAAFLGVFCGVGSWAIDMFFRGFIIDTLLLPGIVAADLKDIYLAIGIAAIFAEMIDNPSINFRWDGWHEEIRGIARWTKSLLKFSIQEFKNSCMSIRQWRIKP